MALDTGDGKAGLQDLLRGLSIAEELKSRREGAEQQLNREAIKEDYRKRVLEAARVQGLSLTPEEIDASFDHIMEALYRFREPQHTLQYQMAKMYVRRGALAKKFGIPAGGVAALALAVWFGLSSYATMQRQAREKDVEVAVAQVCQGHVQATSDIAVLTTSGRKLQIPALEKLAQTSRDTLNTHSSFFTTFCAKGAIEENVTSGNYEEAAQQLPTVRSVLANVQSSVANGLALVTLPPQVEKFYASIKAVAKEAEALSLADSLYKEAKAQIASVNAEGLRQTLVRFHQTESVLNQEYEIRVVAGVKRNYTDQRGRRQAGAYVIVEAVAPSGQILERSILDEEQKRTVTVRRWGERVPESVFQSVRRDKEDNGRIDNYQFGKKQRGYLTDEVTMTVNNTKLQRLGQIMR